MSDLTKFDHLLTGDGLVGLVLREHLLPIEGEGGVIFPPTFANIGYNIDTHADGTNTCLIDTVGS